MIRWARPRRTVLGQEVDVLDLPGVHGECFEDRLQVADAHTLPEQVLQHALKFARAEQGGDDLVDQGRRAGADAVEQPADLFAGHQLVGVAEHDLAEVAGDDGGGFEDPAAGELGDLAAVGVDRTAAGPSSGRGRPGRRAARLKPPGGPARSRPAKQIPLPDHRPSDLEPVFVRAEARARRGCGTWGTISPRSRATRWRTSDAVSRSAWVGLAARRFTPSACLSFHGAKMSKLHAPRLWREGRHAFGPSPGLAFKRYAATFSRMTLEDHVGDIIRKGRMMSGVSAEATARSGGLTEPELEVLEETGRAPRAVNFAAIARTLGLDRAKLEMIAKGWLPATKDLGLWRELRMVTTSRAGLAVNCFLLWDEVSREAALFDTGWEAEPLFSLILENDLQLRHLFVTHGHADHVAALAAVRERFPKVRIHSGAAKAPVDQRIQANSFIHLGSLRITNRDTPGHAEDGTTYIIGNWPEDAPHVAIVGDALFAGSIGRGNQSWDLARQKVREQILSLPPDTLLCPGHGPVTTVAEEKEHNPFFQL